MVEACKSQILIGVVPIRCQREDRHRGTHQGDAKASLDYGEIVSDIIVTVAW